MNNSTSLQRNRFTYVRITSLNMDELPIERVEGRITSGSVNIDGASAVRRTCSLGMVSSGTNINEYNWALNTKFSLEAGIADAQGKIVWYKQGVFVLTSFSISRSTNNCTINLQGKDKMCQLNGENGGTLGSEVDFGNFEEVDKNGDIRKIQRTLKDIIRDAVHYYGGEPLHNIIINDLDDRGVELQEYRYSTPLYLLRKDGGYLYEQATLNGGLTVYSEGETTSLDKLKQYDLLVNNELGGTPFTLTNEQEAVVYCAAKVQYGETIGYTATEMVYNGELIGGIGESVTAILDKIKQLLGNFEYFYDVDGRFIFQEQKNYVNTAWSPLQESSDGFLYVDPTAEKVQFEFTDTSYFTAFNISPNITNVKNDFSVWGTRQGAGGSNIKVHLRYAIDSKPIEYNTISVEAEELEEYNKLYNLSVQPQTSKRYITDLQDGVTYYENNTHTLILPPATDTEVNGESLSGPENEIVFYGEETIVNFTRNAVQIEKHCDWREIIYQMAKDYLKYGHLDDFAQKVAQANPELYPTGKTGYEHYYIDMEGFWRQLYCYNDSEAVPGIEYYGVNDPHPYWNKSVYERPEQLDFWFDFLDLHGELEQFSIKNIGRRPKTVNDNDVKAIYYKDTPEIIYTSGSTTNVSYTGYSYLNIGANFKNMFTASTQGKSAKNALDTLLYNHTYCTESISITSVPIYELEPNKRIYVRDEAAGIDGEYLVSKLTMPLQYNGTMNITATRVVDRII